MGCINVKIKQLNNAPSASINNLGSPLKVKCSIVCALNTLTKYLRVKPTTVQWITPKYGVTYDVEANVKWEIQSK